MKVKTFRNIFFTVVAAYIALWYFCPISAGDILFPNTENTIIETGDFLFFVIALLAVPFFIGAIVFFKHNKYLVMTKLGIAYFTLGFALLVLLPYAAYPSRTEITSETITRHNLIGQVTDVYRFEDAQSVTVGLEASASIHRTGAKARLYFEYSVKFADGYTHDFGGPSDDELWNRIIDSVDKTVKENGIEKKLIGEVYLSGDAPNYIFDNYFDDIAPYLQKIEMLMYGRVLDEEFEQQEVWDDMEEPTYYDFLQ